MSRPEQSGGRVTATAEAGRHARVAPTRGKGRPGPPVSDEGGVRRLGGRTNEQASGASAGSCGRDADCVTPAIRCVLAKRGRSGSGQWKERPEGRGSHRAARVCRQPEAQNHGYAAERSVRGGSAVAEPAATPEDRQSERSEVCRDREKGKYLLPEGWASRRAAVVRRVPEAGRRDSHQTRSGRVQAKRGRAGYGAPATYKAGGPRRSQRSLCPPMARRLKGAPWGGREQARIACGGGAKCCPAGGRSRGVGRGKGWRDACCESQDMAAQPVMSCAKRCRRHDSRKRVRVGGVLCTA